MKPSIEKIALYMSKGRDMGGEVKCFAQSLLRVLGTYKPPTKSAVSHLETYRPHSVDAKPLLLDGNGFQVTL